MATKKKSTIKIPINRHTKSVPHYIGYLEDDCAMRLKYAKQALDAGYEADVPEKNRQYSSCSSRRQW